MRDRLIRIANTVKSVTALSWARNPSQAAVAELKTKQDEFWFEAFSRHFRRSGANEYLVGTEAETRESGDEYEVFRVRGGKAVAEPKDLMAAADKTSRAFRDMPREEKRTALSAFLMTQNKPLLKEFDVETHGDFPEPYVQIPKIAIKPERQGERYSIDIGFDDIQEAVNRAG